MAGAYYLACSCGVQHVVEPRQAGETIACSCGNRVEVPTLVGIRKLPPVADAAEAEGNRWSAMQGVIFTGGLLVALVCLLFVAYTGFQWWSVEGTDPPLIDTIVLRLPNPDPKPDPKPEEKYIFVQVGPDIDRLPAGDLLLKWHALEMAGLPTSGQPRYQVAREIARGWLYLMLGGLGMIVASAIVMSSAFLVGSNSKNADRTK